MMKIGKLKMIPFPSLCEECSAEIARNVWNSGDDGIDEILHHCPHNDAVAHASMRDHEGDRVLVRWVLFNGGEPDAMNYAEQIGNREGVEMHFYNKAKLQ